MIVQQALKTMMSHRGMRQSELARRVGVGRTTVNNQLSGIDWRDKSAPKLSMTVAVLLRYANALDYDLVLVPREMKAGVIAEPITLEDAR